jgi:hypothetical protein
MHVRVALAVAAAFLAAAPPAGATVHGAGIQLRPTAGGDFGYMTPSRAFEGDHVVVHWVSRGGGAPALNDDDEDTIPDYVEQVAAAADQAAEFYAARGFRALPADSGGIDSRTDLYIAELPFGVFGFMAPSSVSWDGAFVVLSAHLDPREPVALGSLRATVGHELFHVVQQAYLGDLPPWVAEGTADAMAALAAPEAHDFADEIRQTRWAENAAGPIADNDPYAASGFWRFLERRDPGLIAALLDRRAAMTPLAQSTDPSWYRSLEAVHRARGKGPLDAAFGSYARELVLDRVLAPAGTMRPGALRISACSPLSIRVLRLALPKGARKVDLAVSVAARGAPRVQLVLPDGRTVVARRTGRVLRLRAALRRGEEYSARLLVTGSALAGWGPTVTVRLAVAGGRGAAPPSSQRR